MLHPESSSGIIGSMEQTIIIIVAVGCVLAIAAAFAAAYLYRVSRERRLRRGIAMLIMRQEAILAGSSSLLRLATHLAECTDRELSRFAAEPEGEDRRAFGDVAMRMRIVHDELASSEVPSTLEEITLDMEDIATAILDAALAAEAREGGDALEGVADMDLRGITERTSEMQDKLHHLAVEHKVEEGSVYGGGLYI
jgi:hypothetical protein